MHTYTTLHTWKLCVHIQTACQHCYNSVVLPPHYTEYTISLSYTPPLAVPGRQKRGVRTPQWPVSFSAQSVGRISLKSHHAAIFTLQIAKLVAKEKVYTQILQSTLERVLKTCPLSMSSSPTSINKVRPWLCHCHHFGTAIYCYNHYYISERGEGWGEGYLQLDLSTQFFSGSLQSSSASLKLPFSLSKTNSQKLAQFFFLAPITLLFPLLPPHVLCPSLKTSAPP